MGIDAAATVQLVDHSTLTPVVCKLVNRNNFNITEWHVSQIGGGVGNPVSVGLYRFEGTGQDGNESMIWSVILKIIQSPANMGIEDMGGGDDQTHWNYWKREIFIYESGLFDSLPEGMVTPRCFGTVELPDNIAWLWLEDITDAEAGNWSLERYALTARHFAQMNGYFAMQPSWLSAPWLGRNRFANWTDFNLWREIPWNHPLIQNRYPDGEQNAFHHMLLEGKRFLAKLDQLPKTICHGDTYPDNFMSRRLADGSQQTVALDWALAHVSSLGEDFGQLAYGAQNLLKTVSLKEVDNMLFESYLNGLRESGYAFDPRQVRFMMAATSAMQIGLFQLFLFSEQLKQEDANNLPVQIDSDQPDCYEIMMAKEAFRLLDVV